MYSRNNIFSPSNQRKETGKRIWIIMVIFMTLLCLLVCRIINYMYFKSESLTAMADAQYTIEEKYGLQYSLIDCKDRPLLEYVVNYYAVIHPVDYLKFNAYTSKYDMDALIFILRNYNSDYDLDKIKVSGTGQSLKYKIDEKTYDKLQDIKGVKGFYTYAANEVIKDRYWKTENLLINTTYNNEDGNKVIKSDDSLEMQIYNKTKNNDFTKIRFLKGVDGEISQGEIIEPKNNINVKLTLNKEVQDGIEAILHREEYRRYDQVGVVLMESSTGKIRAMVQKDDNAYNANLGYPSTNGALPGSIFKVIVEEAGLDMDLIDKDKKYTIDPKIFTKEPNKGNKFTVGEALTKSSNNIFAQLGWQVGVQNIYNYAEKQGMLSKVLNLQQESKGKFQEDLLDPTPAATSLTAIGQNVTMTPIEAISIPNSIINKGIYVEPSIIDSYVDDNNKILEKITSKTSRVLKRETAETVKIHMIDVVNKGTGEATYIKGMNIGGKTGTTTYLDNGIIKSDGWFVGFFNLNETNYSMVVFVNNIGMNVKGIADEEGGGTAAPIFKEVINTLKSID